MKSTNPSESVAPPLAVKATQAIATPAAAKKTPTSAKRPVKRVAASSKKPMPMPVAKPAAVPAAKPVASKLLKPKKIKLVRDSFTIPKLEYLMLDVLKLRASGLGTSARKSDLIRAGIKALAAMPDDQFLAAVKALAPVKTGHPAKA